MSRSWSGTATSGIVPVEVVWAGPRADMRAAMVDSRFILVRKDVNMTRLIFAFLIALAALPVVQGSAQDPTPEPGPEAARLLPEAVAFGDGWELTQTVNPSILTPYSFEMTPDVFREGAAGISTGPNGSRIIIASLLITENRVAIRQSWEDATGLLNAASSGISTDYERDQALETMEAPAGCAEAKRIEGTERFVLLPMGGTMCAVDPDGILIAIISGNFDEQAGVAASDAVIDLALNGASGTPTSLTPGH